MARPRQDTTEKELAILELLWDRGRASIRQITDAIYPGSGAGQYAGVQKQLERMDAKGLVQRDRSLPVHLFSPALDRDALIGRRIRVVMDSLCRGSIAPILSHLLRAPKLTPRERDALRQLIEAGDPRNKAPRNR